MQDNWGRNIHYLRLSVTEQCDLHCRYCRPAGAAEEPPDALTDPALLRLAGLFAACGVDTVRLTGGEPLLRPGLPGLVAGLKAIPGIRRVGLTTNGTRLAAQLPALQAAGLDSVNLSLDALDAGVYRAITGQNALPAVEAGLRAALAGGMPLKLNCVPQPGVNETELLPLAALAAQYPVAVRFIEMMPIGYGAVMPSLSGGEVLARLQERWPELAPLPGAHGALGEGPALYYTAPGWPGCVGLIMAVHGKFCARCNRVRLTSRGFLRLCLASEAGVDLAAPLRAGASDAALEARIRAAVGQKPKEHQFGSAAFAPTRGMYRIGG